MLVTDAVQATMHLVGRGCTGQKQCQAKAHVAALMETMAGPYCQPLERTWPHSNIPKGQVKMKTRPTNLEVRHIQLRR